MLAADKLPLTEAGRAAQPLLLEIVRHSVLGTFNQSPSHSDTLEADGELLLHFASKHGVAPLVWKYLLRQSGLKLQPEQRQRLLRLQALLGLRNRSLSKELINICQQLKEAGVPCLVFKGPSLAEAAYGDLGGRQFGDLDLLADQMSHDRIMNVLLGAGYAVQDQFDFETHLAHSTRPVSVDLHWGFAPRAFGVRLIFNELWSRRQTVILEDQSLPTLSAEDTLLELCIHAAKDFCGEARPLCAGRLRLLNLVDIAMLAKASPDLDPTRLGAIARRARAQRMLAFGLLATAEIIGGREIPLLVQRLGVRGNWETMRAIRQVLDQFSSCVSTPPSRIIFRGTEHLPEWLWRLGLPLDSSLQLCQILCTPSQRDRHFVPLPDTCSWLYYCVRPIRLGWDALRRPWDLGRSLFTSISRCFRLADATPSAKVEERGPQGKEA